MNRAAEELHSGGDGVRVTTNGVHASLRSEDERLQELVSRALGSQQSGRSIGEVMRISRPSGRQPYSVWVNAVARPHTVLTVYRPAVCVLISDPNRRGGPPMPHLQALFKMTPAEARLAALLANGESLRAAARRLSVTYGTARTCLTQLFRKTNTQSQGQLIRLLLACWPGQSPPL
jgi:DNA-binding CsgD family transcriptional regulator